MLTVIRNAWARAVVSGLIAGCIVLTRSECLPMIVIIVLLYPLLAGTALELCDGRRSACAVHCHLGSPPVQHV